MKQHDAAALYAYGTSEGVTKEWDTRGRGRKSDDGSKFKAFLDEVNQHTSRITERTPEEVKAFGGNAHDLHENGEMALRKFYDRGEPAEKVARRIIRHVSNY